MNKISKAILAIVILLSACSEQKADKIFANIETAKGNIKIELFHEATPMTVANFVGLAEGTIKNSAKEEGVPYYDGLKFHRVISKNNGDAQDFMIQGGDPMGTGQGGPGYKFPDEFVDTLNFDEPFLLAMANSGPATNGSQFFITIAPTTWLNQKHTIFGKVVEGQEVVNAIKKDDIMNKVTIVREGAGAKAFDAVGIFSVVQQEAQKKMEAEAAKAALRSQEVEQFESWVASNFANAKKTASGLYYVVVEEGTGKQAEINKKVNVHYRGAYIDDVEFDNSYTRGQPIAFELGIGRVIKGWDEGIGLMKEGAKYKLLIPYTLAYGERGSPPVIPPKATLVFDTELVSVE